jgi:CBS domain-containing protein
MSSNSFDKIIEFVSDQFTVSHVLVTEIESCTTEDSFEHILSRMRENNYDVMPIMDDGKTKGYVEKEALEKTNDLQSAIKLIALDKIVSSNTRITEMFDLFKTSRFFFVLEGNKEVGIVTYSDMNKGPVRAWLFLLVSKLEYLLIERIKKWYADPNLWLRKLSARRQAKIQRTFQNKRKANVDTSYEDCLNLGDIIAIVESDEVLRSRFGYKSRSSCSKEIGGLENLRNCIMHPSDSLISSYEDIWRVKEKTIRLEQFTRKVSAST